jgi:cytochrome c biogenesis factor
VSPELIFPVQLFFKPLTILVWIGAGLMTMGGIMTILRLRRRA